MVLGVRNDSDGREGAQTLGEERRRDVNEGLEVRLLERRRHSDINARALREIVYL